MEKTIKIIIIPHAGGTAMAYNRLKKELRKYHEVSVFEYSGHGKRAEEKLYDTWQQMTEDIYAYIKNEVKDNEEYVLLGNSMGAYLVQDVCHALRERNEKLPGHNIYAACNPFCNIERLEVSMIENSSEAIRSIITSKYYQKYLRN